MKKIFADMDLYKGMILFAVLAIPAAGIFAYLTNERLIDARKAMADAKKSRGVLEKIGEYQNNLEKIKKNASTSNAGDQYRLYFERQITASATQGLKRSDFQISNEQTRKVAKLKAEDVEVTINFRKDGKDEFPLPRSFINTVLRRCEGNSNGVWKVRQLKMRNKEVLETARGKKAPPRTVADNWIIDRLIFARRQPGR
ncbi:MAG: hypothetical protein ACYTG5_22345, partial [Planctomycetota bacterium]|jgi:hypothetical protein